MVLTLSGAVLFVPLCSALASPAVPVALRVLLVALWIVALARPHAAFVAAAAIVPFSSWILTVFTAPPVHLAEALVLATLSGALIAAARQPNTPLRPQRPRLVPAAMIFCAVVICSAAVGLAVTQTGTRAPWLFLQSFTSFLARDYLVGPPGEFVGVADAALLLEGVALMFIVSRHSRDHVVRPRHVLAASAVAAAAAAVLSIAQLAAAALSAESLGALLRGLLASRTSVHVADVNAAGSYFTMAALVALGMALAQKPASATGLEPWVRDSPWTKRSWRWTVVSALLFAAMWISGSRMAIAASIGVGVLWLAARSRLRPTWWPPWAVGAAAVAAGLVLAALAVGLDPRPSAARTASNMVSMRAAFMVTGLRMIASAPVFGVGVGRYFEMSGRFMPPSIYWFYFHENAHNNFLQVAGELGLLGVAVFVWMLAAAAVRLWRGLAASPGDCLLVGAVAGSSAFVVTWLTSHPMLVPEVAYPFWIVLGAAIARADGDAQPPLAVPGGTSEGVATVSRAATAATAAAVALLALSIVPRSAREAATLDLANQSYGFYDWEQVGGLRFRWTSRRATFFVPANARELRLPVRALHIGSNRGPIEVSIAIGGRTLDRVTLATDEWRVVRLRLPVDTTNRRYERIDLITAPTWSPAALLGTRTDVRILGVQVGEPSWM